MKSGDSFLVNISRSKLVVIGFVILAIYILLALLSPFIAPHNPVEVYPDRILQPPNLLHPFGTDGNGMDVFSRVIVGSRLDLGIAICAVLIAFVTGSAIGVQAGYLGGWFDLILLRAIDVLQSIPTLILAMALVAASGRSLAVVVIVIGLLDTPVFTRLVRAETMRIRESGFVESARAVGNPTNRLLLHHVLPNVLPAVLIQFAVRMSWAVKTVAALAFVGIGIQPPTPEWGAMIRVGSDYVRSGQWWVSVFPGLALLGFVFGLNMLTDGLQEILDPKQIED